jgi:glycosyltransferase involved in cell wall biosynthesis
MKQIMEVDAALLREHNAVEIVDLSGCAESFGQILDYIHTLTGKVIPGMLRNEVVIVWTADYPTFPVILLSNLLGKPVVLHVSGYEVANIPEIRYGGQRHRVRGAVIRWCLRHSCRVIVMSREYADLTKKVEPGATVSVIPGCIEESVFLDKMPKKAERFITAYMPYRDAEIVKGIGIFKWVESFYEKEKPRILCGHPHNDLIRNLREAKVYCQLSRTESFGVTVLEAMASGCVPVVTEGGALEELVGDCGVTVPYGNVPKIIEGIQKAMTMDGTAAMARAREFTAQKRRDALERVLRGVQDGKAD